MNFASIESARLQRVLKVLGDKREHTTLEIMTRAKAPAVSAIISELRANGAVIDCKRRHDGPNGAPRWYYKMTKGPRCHG
jgi:predicted transcriptional regulator